MSSGLTPERGMAEAFWKKNIGTLVLVRFCRMHKNALVIVQECTDVKLDKQNVRPWLKFCSATRTALPSNFVKTPEGWRWCPESHVPKSLGFPI